MDIIEDLRHACREKDFERFDRLLAENPGLEHTSDARTQLVLASDAALRRDHQRLERFAETLEEKAFTATEDLCDMALVHLSEGAPARARSLLEELATRPDADGYVFARLGALQLQGGDLDEAAESFKAALDRLPERPELLANLGGLRLRQDRLQEALTYYDRALTQNPSFDAARQQRERVRVALGKADKVLEEREKALEKDPEDVGNYTRLASLQAHLEMYQEAESTLDEALNKFPSNQQARRQLIQLLFNRRHWSSAGRRLLRWHDADPDDFEIRAQLNRARVEFGHLDAADKDLASWPDDEKQKPAYYLVRARLLSERQKQEQAVELLYEALARFPGVIDARQQLVLALNQLGRLEEARKHQRVLAQFAPGPAIEAVQATESPSESDVSLMERFADSPALSREQRAHAGFALAAMRDRRGEHDSAFTALRRANETTRESLDYDWRKHRQQVQATMALYTRSFAQNVCGSGPPSRRPIFVVGMPRSGTTLLEQMLASHPQVYGAGELSVVPKITRLMPRVLGRRVLYPNAMKYLTRAQFYDAGKYYLNQIKEIDNESEMVVDKLPHNFDHIGLIAAMLPNAVIVSIRRDPRDVAVSNFFQNFAAKHGLMGFAFDLEDIGHMLNDHDRIMQHWHEVLPDRVYEVRYEELVYDPEAEISRLLQHCELPWDDRVMRFYETRRPVKTASIRQVREGIYTSSAEKWRRYEQHLYPLETVLAEGFKTVQPDRISGKPETSDDAKGAETTTLGGTQMGGTGLVSTPLDGGGRR